MAEPLLVAKAGAIELSLMPALATVLVLLIDECPEDVTVFREHVKCEVLASTFDQAPESHLRLADIVLWVPRLAGYTG